MWTSYRHHVLSVHPGGCGCKELRGERACDVAPTSHWTGYRLPVLPEDRACVPSFPPVLLEGARGSRGGEGGAPSQVDRLDRLGACGAPPAPRGGLALTPRRTWGKGVARVEPGAYSQVKCRSNTPVKHTGQTHRVHPPPRPERMRCETRERRATSVKLDVRRRRRRHEVTRRGTER